jgi:hypothetical protein
LDDPGDVEFFANEFQAFPGLICAGRVGTPGDIDECRVSDKIEKLPVSMFKADIVMEAEHSNTRSNVAFNGNHFYAKLGSI